MGSCTHRCTQHRCSGHWKSSRGRACRPQAAARVLPEPEREPQNWGPHGPSTRDLGDGGRGLEQRRDSGAPVPFGVYDQAAPARRLQGAGGAQQDTGGQNDAGAQRGQPLKLKQGATDCGYLGPLTTSKLTGKKGPGLTHPERRKKQAWRSAPCVTRMPWPTSSSRPRC